MVGIFSSRNFWSFRTYVIGTTIFGSKLFSVELFLRNWKFLVYCWGEGGCEVDEDKFCTGIRYQHKLKRYEEEKFGTGTVVGRRGKMGMGQNVL